MLGYEILCLSTVLQYLGYIILLLRLFRFSSETATQNKRRKQETKDIIFSSTNPSLSMYLCERLI